MFTTNLLRPLKRVGTSVRNFKVTVVGAANELGRAVCLLLREEGGVSQLRVHDGEQHTRAVAADLAHLPAPGAVRAYSGDQELHAALTGADIVLLLGGRLPRPGYPPTRLTRDNLDYVRQLGTALGIITPMPFVGVATEPINSTTPLLADILKSYGNFDPKKLFGITSADELRAQSMYAECHNLIHRNCIVPVIGGHSRMTAVPLLSQATPAESMSDKSIYEFTERFREMYDMIVFAKSGHHPVQASAYGILQFTRALMSALSCSSSPLVHALVANNDFGTGFFAGRVQLDADGVCDMERYSKLTPYECDMIEHSCRHLREEVTASSRLVDPSPF